MNTPVSESLALQSLALRLEAQEAKLPAVTSLPTRLADASSVGRQITELGHLIAEMGQAIEARAAVEPLPEHVLRTAWTYGGVADRMGQTVSALGAATDQLATLTHLGPLRGRRDVDQALATAGQVIEEAVSTAHSELAEAGRSIRTTVAIIDAQRARFEAARARSAFTSPQSAPSPQAGAPAPAGSLSLVRSR
ncbi:hypothetical protein ACIQI7_15490 [Kitasatospora sp. NPDC092039]|uniref:hypothetical protein n=1 Tax=Kitasatospora sp. NPDC092039 TaxID=3364086 RepID=UPI0037F9B3A4